MLTDIDSLISEVKAMSTHTIAVQDAEGRLADLMSMVAQGEEIIITNPSDGSRVRLLSMFYENAPRVAGLHQGKIHMSDDFDEPLDDNFL